MTTAINNMTAVGATNAEDALAQVGGPNGLTDQSAVPADQRVQQYVIFFTDGMPTAFRGKFKNQGTDNIDAVVCGTGNTCDQVYYTLGATGSETWLNIDPNFTGDGKIPGTSQCAKKLQAPPPIRPPPSGMYSTHTPCRVIQTPYSATLQGTPFRTGALTETCTGAT